MLRISDRDSNEAQLVTFHRENCGDERVERSVIMADFVLAVRPIIDPESELV